MTSAEHALWGRFTYDLNRTSGSNMSVGDVMRQALAKGAEQLDATLAKQIRSIRAERLRMKHGIVCLFVGLLAIGSAALSGADMRRSPRGRRIEIEEVA